MDNYKGVLVCGEMADGKLAPITIELLGVGRKLADELGEELSVLLLGSKSGDSGHSEAPANPQNNAQSGAGFDDIDDDIPF